MININRYLYLTETQTALVTVSCELVLNIVFESFLCLDSLKSIVKWLKISLVSNLWVSYGFSFHI